MNDITRAVVNKIVSRGQQGDDEHGGRWDDWTDLECLEELSEELVDALMYAEQLKRRIHARLSEEQ